MSPQSPVPARCLTPFAVGLLLPLATALAQSTANGPYHAESFEAHRYQLGTLPGLGYADGQDGWMLFDSLALVPNLAAATVQTGVVRTGTQAIAWHAGAMTPGCFGELRRNAMFNLTTGVIECEMDFRITSSSSPSTWEFYTQPAPIPASCQMRWSIAPSGQLSYLTTANRTLVTTGFFVTKDVWHHARTVVDIFGNTTAIHIDGVRVGSGQPIATMVNLPAHGFTQINVVNAGNDTLHLDNVILRERTAAHGLTVDQPRLPVNRHSVLRFGLAGGTSLANRAYGVLGTMTGTSPGTPLGSIVLPLNVDAFTGLLIANFGTALLPDFVGTLNGSGNGYATLDTLIAVPPALLGLDLQFAWITTQPVDAVSETCRVRVTLN